jgi:hypothetical protein
MINLSSKFLIDNNIKPESDIPLWFNSSVMFDNNKLANDFQIKLMPFHQTMGETMEYFNSLNWNIPKAGLDIQTERELIEKTLSTSKGLDAILSDE